jgi:hypothetical protein
MAEKESCVSLSCGGVGHPKIRFVHPEGFAEIPRHEWMRIAQFLYDPVSDAFKPFGSDRSFGKRVCHQCHTVVRARDYIFTGYPKR